ncbi:BRAP2 RING ZnF UBP domain-containing protein 1 [Linum grandiflorum]
MFILRVHSVDANHPLNLEENPFSLVSSAANSTPNPKYSERRGVVHLYRSASRSSLPNPTSRSTSLFVVAAPNYLSADDFVRFCESHIDNVLELVFIRNDGMEDRYSVLINLDSQSAADIFYNNFNGKRFSPAEAEVCHILFVLSVDYTESAEDATTPPTGFTELPTCPICLERLDPDTSGILSTLCDHSFQCSCTSKWTYLSCQVCRLCQQEDEKPTCAACGTLENMWVCLLCGFVGCGRYKEGHAIRHWQYTEHRYSLDLRTQQIWDYVGDNYVHRLNQSKAYDKSIDVNANCRSVEGDCGTCECSDDSEFGGALYSSKVEAVSIIELLTVVCISSIFLQYYESLITEAKSKQETSISEGIEEVLKSTMHELQNKLDMCELEKNAVAEVSLPMNLRIVFLLCCLTYCFCLFVCLCSVRVD